MKIAFVGMGEAGSAIIKGWGTERAAQISAFDIKTTDPTTADEISDRCDALGIRCCQSLPDALEGAEIVFCTVTPDQAVNVAQAANGILGQGSTWCDLNSCAPSSKRTSARLIESASGRYVDVAVMAPVYPKLNMVPLLVSGPHATDTAQILEKLPMSPQVVDGPIGAASSIKMVRSIMVKGLEALTAECTLAAAAAGVEKEIFDSLAKSYPGTDWNAQAAYNFERSIVHGERRAAEMEEVCKTLDDLGLPTSMTKATVDWQRRIARSDVEAPTDAREIGAAVIAEMLLPKIRNKNSD